MVTGNAADDAIRRTESLPGLRVGLHLVLVEGRAALPPSQVPDLTDSNGEFSPRPLRAGLKYALRPGIRRQLEAEIRAQFEAFRATGLTLDHVDTHNHLHLHPGLLRLIVNVGGEFGLRAVRFPYEPPLLSWRASRRSLLSKVAFGAFLQPLLRHMRKRLAQARIRHNDFLVGLADSGRMTLGLTTEYVQRLPDGVTEFHFHPATRRCPEIDRTMADYDPVGEFRALTDVALVRAFDAAGAERITFSEL
jgi:hopanoid biosynthesis associated protein HpnK